MRITKGLVENLETVFKQIGYTLRYEKGNFIGGYCMVENQKLVLLNKYLPLEGRGLTLIELLSELNPPPELLTEEQKKLLSKIRN
ncbi:MAG: hypothetical protein RMM53_05655 [Bacteroidia bacterium]|nr:hypothetical protein [Bacteroidia bacterium]